MNDLTVIVAVYNTAQYLPQCLDSIFNQSYKGFDILMIDDCSTDGSGEICEKYKDKYKNRDVEVLHNEVNLGVSAAREKGICHAKTEWIYIVDSDDLIHPDVLKTLMHFVMSPIGEKSEIVKVGQLSLTDMEIRQYSWERVENPRFMVKYGNLSIKEKAETIGFLGISKRLLKRSLCLSVDYAGYKKKWPRYFLDDGLYSVLLYQKAEVVALLEDKMYIHRERINSAGRALDRFDYLRDWVETDQEMYRILRKIGENEMCIQVLVGILNNISKLVYFIDRNNIDENETRRRMVCSFNKYYRCVYCEKAFYKTIPIIQRISWRMFSFNSNLWVKTIGYIYFEYVKSLR